jgi:hypothetical protein
MAANNDETNMSLQEPTAPQPDDTAAAALQAEQPQRPTTFEQLRQSVSEDDEAPTGSLTLKKVLGGDILSAEMVRSQVWLIMLVAVFITVYVASRYQCQQDLLDISSLEKELTSVKTQALSTSSLLTERSRESHVTKALKAMGDSLLKSSQQPPYIIEVPED